MSSYNQGQENFYVDRGLTPLQPDYIEKLKLQANIILGDFIFNTIDDFGVVWVITDIQGWWNMPSAEMPDIARGFGDGSYDVQGRYNSRSLTLQGVFLTQNPAQVEAARDRLIQACDLVYKGVWLKTGNDPIRASFVRLSGEVQIDTRNARGRTEFQIGLRAADPIKYEWNDASPDGSNVVEIPAKNVTAGYDGTGTVVNIGNYPVPCIFEISGPIVSPATIYNRTTDKLILITKSLKGSVTRAVVNKQLSFDLQRLTDVATLTTTTKHEFSAGDIVYISNVGEPFDGEHTILSTPTDTTFTFSTEAASIQNVLYKSLSNSVATIETTSPHGFSDGDEVTISGVDNLFDGSYVILDTPDSNSFTYAKNRVPPQTVTGKVIVSNIATLTTASDHQFIVGDTVTVSGVGVPFDGSYTVTAIPSSTQFSYAATRTNSVDIVRKAIAPGFVNVDTAVPHGFVVGETVVVSGVDSYFDGSYTITSTPLPNRFQYEKANANRRFVSVYYVTSNTAFITTSAPHNFLVGEKVDIQFLSPLLDGQPTITAVPSNTTIAFSITSPNIAPTQSTTGYVKPVTRKVKSFSRRNNIVTVTTTSPHDYFLGNPITAIDLAAGVNGNFTVASIVNANTFTYVSSGADIANSEPTNGYIQASDFVDYTDVIPAGSARVSGSLPFSGASGTASVSDTIAKIQASGRAIKKNDIQFTPGVQNATAVLSSDLLEIDTKNRDVAFNGVPEGARGYVDVLADFIELAPGPNIIEFEDAGNPESTGSLRIYYRSGWLG